MCHFAFPFFKFWIIPSPPCNSFLSDKEFQQETEHHLFLIFFKVILEIYIPTNILLNVFDTVNTFPNPFALPNYNLHLLSLVHFFDKQFAINDRILWIRNIFSKLLFLFCNCKWMMVKTSIEMKAFFEIFTRDLKFKIILSMIKTKLYLCNPLYFWSLLLRITCF